MPVSRLTMKMIENKDEELSAQIFHKLWCIILPMLSLHRAWLCIIAGSSFLLVIMAMVPSLMTGDLLNFFGISVNSGDHSSNGRRGALLQDMSCSGHGFRSPQFLWVGPAMESTSGDLGGQESSEVSVSSVMSQVLKQDVTVETQASLKLAREMTNQGKKDKALKILQHALALNPFHPDVLNEYGEYLERTNNNIILAEHMYCRALVSSPSHTRAIANRRRTLPLVEEIDQSRFDRIDQKRDMLLRVPEGHPGLRRMVHESYFRHLYHTTAMEGNTFSLSQTRSFVETRIVVSGKSIMEHNEILGMEAAYQFLNSSIINRIGSVTVQDIVDIHRRVLGYVDPINAGNFRTTQVFVGEFVPPGAWEVSRMVAEFVEWLNSEDAAGLHPIERAALAHYKLVYVHPFYDGNGRTSRLLMNLVLMHAGYPPIIVPVEEKQTYYRHLETANNGDVRPFIRFIARCAEQTIEEFLWASVENINRTFPELSRTVVRDDDDSLFGSSGLQVKED